MWLSARSLHFELLISRFERSTFGTLLGFTGFHWVLLGFTGFYWVLTSFQWVLVSFTGFYWVLLGFTGRETFFFIGSAADFYDDQVKCAPMAASVAPPSLELIFKTPTRFFAAGFQLICIPQLVALYKQERHWVSCRNDPQTHTGWCVGVY